MTGTRRQFLAWICSSAAAYGWQQPLRRPNIPQAEGVRTDEWKYTRYLDTNPSFEELFHLAGDPKEKHNLASSEERAGQLERLRNRRAAWLRQLSLWRADSRWEAPA